MSLENTKKALEKHLALISSTIDTAYEGVNYTPKNDTPYQYVQLVPYKPQNPTLGDDYFRDIGEFQVFLCYPSGKGTGEILSKAESVRTHFKRGVTLTEGVSKILITDTPKISGASIMQGLIVCPVLIRYSVEDF